jgi:hypothetical protein
METKTCTKCGETKPLDEYHKDKSRRSGRRAACKECCCADRRDYVTRNWDEVHRKDREHQRRYRARPEVKARQSARHAEYRKSRPHVWWEGDYRKRMRGYGFEPRVSSFTREELHERWGTQCFHCGSEDGTTLDHYPTPISRGGEHSLENCRPSCMNCQHYSWREDFTPTAES